MLRLDHISFSYLEDRVVLDNISFSVEPGSYLAIVGESGCGKSTLLEIIYGLLHVDRGSVSWNGDKLLGPNFHLIPGEDFMKYLPQDFDLMPYTTVIENVGKFLSSQNENKTSRIAELLRVVDMEEFADTKVKNLSGGQKQRVAIAKVLAKEPEILLLDEPFSHIDNFRKNSLRRNIFRYLKSKNITCIVATHDTTDALSFADDIIVLKDGDIIGKGSPEELYKNPENEYIASFFNEVNAISTVDEGKKILYPEQVQIDLSESENAIVEDCFFKGFHYLVELKFNNQILYASHKHHIKKGTKVGIKFLNTR